ncbi:50S ribosomal protein L25/general stress protein Ctc [Opacimonas viscosa]|uniref:Large ribosomal subunit protein bL25 n=1 Tax=Opacimonas viscosa TaxID=2961944 RepID=A0AA41WW41_9ALTE|nr:50S ribosomal protein L25/general stress protein Ctc [Opacimonas viscosa]MCP3427654.1 50S ribosomal protein L25/general stress protein Ctc [Opacimonas viscosa]
MSEAIFHLEAEVRTDLGKGASRRLRREDKVPAIVYGADKEPVSVTLAHNKLVQAQEFEAFYSHVLTLDIAGEKVDAIVKDMQRHPYKPKILHVDFLRVDASKAIHTTVPVHFINEDTAPAIKTEGGHAEHHINEIDVACLPGNLPEFIEVDLTNVALGQTLHLSDVTFPEGVSSVELAKGESHDLAVVTIKAAKVKAADEAAEGEADSE